MRVVTTRAALAEGLAELAGTRALVMTMGALHEGHLTLVRRARDLADHVVVSIYVNPLQFGPNEDFASYPRDLEGDLALLEPEGVALVLAPTDAEMYPREPLVRIDPGPVARILEGRTRPGHFAGVLQVVHKVLNLTAPDVALFGRKDAQQLALVTTMVEDLDMAVRIVPVDIVRDDDGVARSSRNAYLDAGERVQARALSRALSAAAGAAGEGPDAAMAAARAVLDGAEGVRLDYLVLVDPTTFTDLAPGAGTGLMAVAAWVGPTRLIDNALLDFGGRT